MNKRRSPAAVLLAGMGLLAMQPVAPAQPVDVPSLTVDLVGTNAVISWKDAAPGFVLQGNPSLGESAGWLGVPEPAVLEGENAIVTQSVGDGSHRSRFFRLAVKGEPAGIDYLQARQNLDGTWGDPDGAVFRETAGCLEALQLLGLSADYAYYRGFWAVLNRPHRNNDDLARKCVVLRAGSEDVSTLVNELLSSQNSEAHDVKTLGFPDRGWGLANGYGSTTLDTALALRAIHGSAAVGGLCLVRGAIPAGGSSATYPLTLPSGSSSLVLKLRSVSGSARFLLSSPGGGRYTYDSPARTSTVTIGGYPATEGLWSFQVLNQSGGDITCTAEVGFDLPEGGDTFRFTTALTYLCLAQNADGGWGIGTDTPSQFMITAEVLRALASWQDAFGPEDILQRAMTWLRARQQADGSFNSEAGADAVLETALAVLAIRAADPAQPLASALAYLDDAQLPDGSWSGEPLQTALALQALYSHPSGDPIAGQPVSSSAPVAPIKLYDQLDYPRPPPSRMAGSVTGTPSPYGSLGTSTPARSVR
ncbi:MAG: hypothetical protein H6827_09285 [Planctomycetes bacterium]|nr:hypothetical protein [Planctomycetota bacterium]